ncbi:hypothetical protein [Streptomyces sp. NPDC050164]|uniref:hypothetical protein n=1 Tax=Streptomyces sp. NPDC050164 TaxID=3365605 RepID=UPI00379EF6A0
MFRPSEYADGATNGEPQGPPNVYLPQPDPPPTYDAYADPAAAHGWQDAYDNAEPTDGMGDTRELPPVPARGRTGGGHRSRRRPSPWRTRRVAVAAGAASVAALIAWFSLSGAPSGGTRSGEGGRTGPTAGDPASPTGTPGTPSRVPATGAPAVGEDPSSGTAPTSPAAETSRPSSEGGAKATEPSAGTPASAATAPSTPTDPTTTSAPGNSDRKPGHGHGSTKDPSGGRTG